MYLLGLLFLMSTFFLEKFLICNYYQKCKIMNGEVNLNTLGLFKLPILFHVLFSFVVYSDG